MKVEIKDYKKLIRPTNQGSVWWLSKRMKVLEELKEN
jgi:hypothetical protein